MFSGVIGIYSSQISDFGTIWHNEETRQNAKASSSNKEGNINFNDPSSFGGMVPGTRLVDPTELNWKMTLANFGGSEAVGPLVGPIGHIGHVYIIVYLTFCRKWLIFDPRPSLKGAVQRCLSCLIFIFTLTFSCFSSVLFSVILSLLRSEGREGDGPVRSPVLRMDQSVSFPPVLRPRCENVSSW